MSDTTLQTNTLPHTPTPLSRQRHIRREDIDALILKRLGQECYCTLSSGLWRVWRANPARPKTEHECLVGRLNKRALVEWLENYQQEEQDEAQH